MKRFTLFFIMTTLCITLMAQGKLTPRAQMRLMQKKAKVDRQAATRVEDQSLEVVTPEYITLVVTVKSDNMGSVVAQMKSAGAEVCSRLGRQVIISIPTDSVPSLQRIKGVWRIDNGHRARWKSDVTRHVTGVDQLNGLTVVEGAMTYTGKDVTICLIDGGFDFQHPAFKDAEGRSRIKCVYLMGDNNGHKFTVSDPDLGDYTFPGSVYDTPELIATLTTDENEEYHGTHTAGIAAGSISPLGFGGMAPEADIVLVPLNDVEVEGFDEADATEYMELALAFVSAYAQQSDKPVVLSCSANNHDGPHNGTSSMNEAIEEVSQYVIPVFSAGNEGGYPIHLYQKFTATKNSVKTFLMAIIEDESGEYKYLSVPDVTGYVRSGDEASIQLKLVSISAMGRLSTLWTSEKCTATPGCEDQVIIVNSEDDATLAQYFEGMVGVGAMEDENGRLCVAATAQGGMDKLYLWMLTVSGSEGTEIDLWDNLAGFGGIKNIGLPGYVDGDSDMSGGDWTSTEGVISVGAYCANVQQRECDGSVTDTSEAEDEDDYSDTLNEIAWFSSYGTSFNGINQPVVCAPGVNIVSSVSHYAFQDMTYADNMQWQDYPYSAESGTSMACPAVAGIVALWLQAKPDMTLQDVKDVLANSSVNDDYTAKNPIRWGYGKISATKGLEYINTNSAIRTVDFDNSKAGANAYYDLQGRCIHTAPHASGMYIHQGRKVVVK